MPISSFPISVNASVNLSDINIDTDLNMGANSIIGYAPTTLIKDYKLVNLSQHPLSLEDYLISGEKSLLMSTSSQYFTIDSKTFSFDNSKLNGYVSITSGEIKNTASFQFRLMASHTEVSTTGNLFTDAYVNTFYQPNYVDIKTTVLGKKSLTITPDIPLYITGGGVTGTGQTVYYKDLNVRIAYCLKPSTNFNINDLDIKGIVLNGGTFTVDGNTISDGFNEATRNIILLDDLTASNNLQYSGNVLALIKN